MWGFITYVYHKIYENNGAKVVRKKMEVYYCEIQKSYVKFYLKIDCDNLNMYALSSKQPLR